MVGLYASHPTWVRGLKFADEGALREVILSHPTWVRGLKYEKIIEYAGTALVAPYMGAWIEML